MKKYIVLLLAVILTLGCSGPAKEKKETLAKINNYEISREEFEEEFKVSTYGSVDTLESRKEFLNTLINRKLILQDAQKKGLDKDRSFLKMIEKFWEQSLLKIVLDKKSKEIASSVRIDEQSIKEAYDNMSKEGKTDRTYEQMYGQINWELTRERESQLMNDWVNQLHKKANIKINEELFNSPK